MAAGLHISISAETVATIGGLNISNSMLTSLIVSFLLISFAIIANSRIKNTDRPQGVQNVVEWMVESLYSLIYSVTDSHKKTVHFFPIIATFFFFLFANNWFGLLPGVGTIGFREVATEEHASLNSGMNALVSQVYAVTEPHAAEAPATSAEEHATVEINSEEHRSEPSATEDHAATASHSKFVPYLRAGTADLNTTLALALISVVMTQAMGFSYLNLSYLSKYFVNPFSNPIGTFVGLLELVSELGKILSFAFRLFGNVFAGEVLLAVIGFLAPVVVPMPFYGLEIFVGLIQALVFALLSMVFFNMATISHDEH